MRKSVFYPKLAFLNIRRNSQFYLPFILTCIATTAMFYIMCFLTYNDGINKMEGAAYLSFILQLGCVVIGIFSAVFLFYTNSFLMKRRQKELGLYNILGMGKRNLASVLLLETLYVAFITLICGLALGILLSKLTLLMLCKLIGFAVPFGFEVSIKGILNSVYLFCGIFAVILLSNLVRIKLSSPIELLHGSNVGEKEPKTKWVLALLGIITLAAGYYIAIVTDAPLQAIMLFFVAVLLVIIGTYLLFTASSIAILKRLKSKNDYYYTTKHFIPVSGMIYRMKQNAVGLANICILATMVLVMVSGTICLYLGTEDAIKNTYPTELVVEISNPTADVSETMYPVIEKAVSDCGLSMSNVSDFRYLDFACNRVGDNFGNNAHPYVNPSDNSYVYLLSASEYKRLTGDTAILAPAEIYAYSDKAKLSGSISVFDISYKIIRELNSFPPVSSKTAIIPNHYFFVFNDDTYKSICASQTSINQVWYLGFDAGGASEQQVSCRNAVDKAIGSAISVSSSANSKTKESAAVSCRAGDRDNIYKMNGGFLFLGLFLGLVFLIATVLIIYYKQLSEGYDDKERFEIMQKVGLSRSEIKKAIHSQILVVFFLPLGMAVVHIAFAFKMITKLLLVLSLTNTTLFALCTLGTVAVFALIYGIVYLLTAKVYLKIVS